MTGKVKKTADTSGAAPAEIPKITAEPVHTDQAPVITTPKLRVNGIAFQNSSADSMAIVNGTPVSGGSIVEGATVEEIRRDRVLFQRNGEKFEIQLGQSNEFSGR
jgi:type II secretory pathway component PulC